MARRKPWTQSFFGYASADGLVMFPLRLGLSLSLLYLTFSWLPMDGRFVPPLLVRRMSYHGSFVVVDFYHDFLPKEDQATIPALEVEVKLVREFKEDEEVEQYVGGIISYLGCTRTHNSKIFKTLELYWHTKTMVALGILPKDEIISPTEA
jgi:hypothetical protein